LDEELSKIKDKLAARHAEREKKKSNGKATNTIDDDFFDGVVHMDRRSASLEHEMGIEDDRPAPRSRKRAQTASDDEDAPVTSKRQKTTTRAQPTKKPPARKAASRTKAESHAAQLTPGYRRK